MRKLFAIATAMLVLLFPCAALADSTMTAGVSPQKAQPGETVIISGTAGANELLSLKITDSESNIIYYTAVRADSGGNYSLSFEIPDIYPQELTVTAGNGSNVATAEITVYIQKYYTVTFSRNGGSTDAVPASMAVKQDFAISTMPSDPAREGYTFAGWYRESACTNAWESDDLVTDNITLYAKWAINTYNVVFYKWDGSTQIGNKQTVAWGQAASSVTPPTREGYTFTKWKLTGDNESVETSLDAVKENIKAVAVYTENDATPSATPTATPDASSTYSPSPTPVSDTTPAASTKSASATPGRTVTPVTSAIYAQSTGGSEDEFIIIIEPEELPAGAVSLRLASGRIIPITDDILEFSVGADEIDSSGKIPVTILDGDGNEIATYMIQVNTSGTAKNILIFLYLLLAFFIMLGAFLIRVYVKRCAAERNKKRGRRY